MGKGDASSLNARNKAVVMVHAEGIAKKAIEGMNAAGTQIRPLNVTVKIGNHQRAIRARQGDYYENEDEQNPAWAKDKGTVLAQSMSMMSSMFDQVYGTGKDEDIELTV